MPAPSEPADPRDSNLITVAPNVTSICHQGEVQVGEQEIRNAAGCAGLGIQQGHPAAMTLHS